MANGSLQLMQSRIAVTGGDRNAIVGQKLGDVKVFVMFRSQRHESGHAIGSIEEAFGILQIGGFNCVSRMRSDVAFFGVDEGPLDVNAGNDFLSQRVLSAEFDQATHPKFEILDRIRNERRQDLVTAIFDQTFAGVVKRLCRQIVSIEVGSRIAIHLDVQRFHMMIVNGHRPTGKSFCAELERTHFVELGDCQRQRRGVIDAAMPAGNSGNLNRLHTNVGAVDPVGIEERVAKYTTRSIKGKSKLFGLRLAVSMVDLTTLEGKDTPGKVASLCQKAVNPHEGMDVPQVAAVCVYPSMVKHARKALGDSKVRIASVATAFPSGQAPLKTRLAEVRSAVGDGADEIDMVINRGAFLAGDHALVQDEISAVLEACGEARLKVILEVSELETCDNIRAASFLAMRVLRPGDFIKTSTGKTSLNATLGNNQVMLEAIRDFFLETGIPIAMKPAGGIRTAKQALQFLIAVKETLGDEWLNNNRYRFGASALLNDLVRQIQKQTSGAYQAPYSFSEAAESY